jgi:hypothetical protein
MNSANSTTHPTTHPPALPASGKGAPTTLKNNRRGRQSLRPGVADSPH